jgi:predicted transcriptional regulator
MVYEYISQNPGSYLNKAAQDMGMNINTIRYHLDNLEHEGLITSKNDMNLRTYFVIDTLDKVDRNITSLLQQKRFRDMIIIVIARPGITHKGICQELALKESTVTKYLALLIDRNIIIVERMGKEKHYSVSEQERVIRMLMVYKRSFWDEFVDNTLEIVFE